MTAKNKNLRREIDPRPSWKYRLQFAFENFKQPELKAIKKTEQTEKENTYTVMIKVDKKDL